MGYALLWVESLATVLVLLALVTAVTARWRLRFGQRVVPVVLALVLVAAAALATAGLCYLHHQFDAHPISNPQSIAAIGWTALLAFGSAMLLTNGLRRPMPELIPAAREWSVGRLALAFVALAAVTTITFTNMDLAMKIQLSVVRAEAGAKTLSAVPPRVPDRENAALLYQEAFEHLPDPERVPPLFRDKAANGWKDYDRAAFDPKDKDLREYLRTQERGLVLVRQAAAMPGCSFDHDYSLGFAMPIPEMTRLPHAATLLAYDALVKAADGDSRAALADVAAIYGVASHMTEPVLIAVKVAAGIEMTAGRVLRDVIELSKPAAADLAQLPLADTVSYRRAVRRAMVTEETAFGLAAITGIAAGDADLIHAARSVFSAANVSLLASPLYRVFFLDDDLAAYRRVMQDIHQLVAKPYHEARAEWEAFDKSWQRHRRGILTAFLAPSVQRLVVIATEADAERSLVHTAVALTAYKAKTGSYPAKLDALVPEYLPRVPLDPFSGRSLRLKRDGAEAVIYSVGQPVSPETSDGDLFFSLR
jgi:hypothetical protein